MNSSDHEKIRKLIRKAIAPLDSPELQRDLWPRMLRRLDERPIRASRLDWALVALVMIWVFIFPDVIPGLLYQL